MAISPIMLLATVALAEIKEKCCLSDITEPMSICGQSEEVKKNPWKVQKKQGKWMIAKGAKICIRDYIVDLDSSEVDAPAGSHLAIDAGGRLIKVKVDLQDKNAALILGQSAFVRGYGKLHITVSQGARVHVGDHALLDFETEHQSNVILEKNAALSISESCQLYLKGDYKGGQNSKVSVALTPKPYEGDNVGEVHLGPVAVGIESVLDIKAESNKTTGFTALGRKPFRITIGDKLTCTLHLKPSTSRNIHSDNPPEGLKCDKNAAVGLRGSISGYLLVAIALLLVVSK
jgi:hypothetical protein